MKENLQAGIEFTFAILPQPPTLFQPSKRVTLPRKSGEKVWNVFHKENDESKCSGMQ